MNEQNEISASILLRSARALAGYAASELRESALDLSQPPGTFAFPAWHDLLTQCLEELAAALAMDRPRLFVEHVGWLRRFLAARGVDDAALRAGLESLAHVLAAELSRDVADVALRICREGSQSLLQESAADVPPLSVKSDNGRLAASYLLALLEGDRARAMRLILDAAQAGHSVSDLYLQVLLPAQTEGGRMWQDGEINIAEEHFTTATTKMIMAQLHGRTPWKAPNGKTLLTAAVAGNQHDIGLQALADFFETDGWRVIQLGCDMPVRDLVEAVGFYGADLAGLSVCLSAQLPVLRRTIESLRRGERGDLLKILVGGRGLGGAPELATEFGADGYAADPVAALALARALVGLPPDAKPAAEASLRPSVSP